MNALVLYCKSYQRDVLRVRRLCQSVERFNDAQLPMFVSAPKADQALFRQHLPGWVRLIEDEAIVSVSPGSPAHPESLSPRLAQQIIKSEFWRLGEADNYLCLDSDSYFIRPFQASDFIHPDGDAYTVIHQNKALQQLAANRGIDKVQKSLEEEDRRFRELLGRKGPIYSYMPSPFIWSARVWRSLVQHYLEPRGLSLWQAVTEELPESRWYGESLLLWQAIPLRPVEPLFQVYHYDWQYFLLRRLGENEDRLKRNYLGVVMQSNWQPELDYGSPLKPLPSRLLRRIKRFFRRLQASW